MRSTGKADSSLGTTMVWRNDNALHGYAQLATSRPAVSLTVLHPQIVAGHFFGLGNSEHPEHGRRNVLQRTVGLQRKLLAVFGNHDERNGMCGVSGVGTAGLWVDHHFSVAVVGGDKHGAAFGSHSQFNSAEAGVHGFDSFNCRLDLAGVADHVSISEVDDDDVEYAILDGFHDSVGDSGCEHFRLQIVGGHFRRRNEDALFTGKWLLEAAVKEIGDVSIFLSL